MIDGVPQERIRTVNPLREKKEFLANKTVKVNPNGGKQGGIPNKESPGIANNKSDPNVRQKELVPRRPRGNSNKNPIGVIPLYQRKQRGTPEGKSHLNFMPKYDQSGHKKEINS